MSIASYVPRTISRRLSAWGGLFVASRLLCLFFFPDGAWTPEEAFRGAIAVEFQHALRTLNLRFPFWCHQADSYLGGSLITSALTVLNQEVFGLRLISLKLSALYFALGAMLVTYLWLHREFGERAANRFAVLYLLAPPAFTFLGLVAMGYHTESALFLGIALYLHHRLRMEQTPRRDTFLFSLLAGFAFWFSNINALFVLSAIFSLPPKIWFRNKKWVSAGIFLGMAPWLAQNISTHFSAFQHLAASFDGSRRSVIAPTASYFGKKLLTFLVEGFPLSNGLPSTLAYVYSAILFLAVVAALRNVAHPLRRFYLCYCALFLGAYVFSKYSVRADSGDLIQFRYLQQLYLFTFAVVAAGAFRFQRAVIAGLATVSVVGFLLLPKLSPPGRIFTYRSYSFYDLSAKLMDSCMKGPENFLNLKSWLGSYSDAERAQLEVPLWSAYNFSGLPESGNMNISGFEESSPFAHGLGAYLAVAEPSAKKIITTSQLFRGAAPAAFWRGVAENSHSFMIEPELFEKIPANWRSYSLSLLENVQLCLSGHSLKPAKESWAVRGQGAAIVDCNGLPEKIHRDAENLSTGQDATFRENLAWGLGQRLRLRHLPDPAVVVDRIHLLPKWAWPMAIEGALNLEHAMPLPAGETISDFLAPSPEEKRQ